MKTEAHTPMTTETKTQHTPGPWSVGNIPVTCERTPNDPQDMHWPIFWGDWGCAAHVFMLEDARLIAAAPDLLAALKAMLQRVDCPCHCEDEWCDGCRKIMQSARAAIARAEGRAE